MRDLEGGQRVLLHQQHRGTLVVDLEDGGEDAFQQDGGKPHGGFVEQEQARQGHQRPGNGQHLLLATRQGAGSLPAAFLEAREQHEHALDIRLDGRPSLADEGAHCQVLFHTHFCKYLTAFGHQGNAAPHDLMGRQTGQFFAIKKDAALGRLEQPADGLQHGRFAGAVGADQADDLPGFDLQRDVVQGADLVVIGVDVLDAQ